MIELSLPNLHFVQAYTPTNQATLNSSDTDEGSGTPALLPGHLALIGGKDGLLRVLNLGDLDGRRHRRPEQTGGELQILPTPGSAELFSAPAVWHSMVFVADGGGTTGYSVSHRRLHVVWSNSSHGTSPVVAGGLLYVYDMDSGGVNVYAPRTGKLITTLELRRWALEQPDRRRRLRDRARGQREQRQHQRRARHLVGRLGRQLKN